MKTKSKKDNEKLTVYVSGRINVKTAPDFENAVLSQLDGVKDLTLDMTELEFLSSSGLRALLKIQKTMNFKGSMKLINVSDDIMEVFGLTGFDNFLVIE